MSYTEQDIAVRRARAEIRQIARDELAIALRRVLNAPKYNCLDNVSKADVLLELENEGEYDPLG